jgi:hypothetical protein
VKKLKEPIELLPLEYRKLLVEVVAKLHAAEYMSRTNNESLGLTSTSVPIQVAHAILAACGIKEALIEDC